MLDEVEELAAGRHPDIVPAGLGAAAVRIQQAYPLAFFDLHLRGRRSQVLAGPGPAFPEIRFVG